jgi:hypothetical protein
MLAEIRERLAVSKRTAHRVYMQRCNLKKINEVEGKGSIVLKSQTYLQLKETRR